MSSIRETNENLVDMFSDTLFQEKFDNRQMLLKILENVRFLGRQGLPLSGNENEVVLSICADTLVAYIRDTLIRMNLSIQNCRGQCYDGASNMAGSKSGVAAQIKTEEPRAIFTHCYSGCW